jgi:hypothetical protein
VSSHFGSWSSDGVSNLQKTIARIKTHRIKKFLISLEIGMYMFKMGWHDPFGYSKHRLWLKGRARNQIDNLISNH